MSSDPVRVSARITSRRTLSLRADEILLSVKDLDRVSNYALGIIVRQIIAQAYAAETVATRGRK